MEDSLVFNIVWHHHIHPQYIQRVEDTRLKNAKKLNEIFTRLRSEGFAEAKENHLCGMMALDLVDRHDEYIPRSNPLGGYRV